MRIKYPLIQNVIASLAIICLVTSASFGDVKVNEQPNNKNDIKKPQPKKPIINKGVLKPGGRMVFSRFGGRSKITLVSQQQIQTEIKLSDPQREDITKLSKEFHTKNRNLYKTTAAIKTKEERKKAQKQIRAKRNALNKETDIKVDKVLDDVQIKRIKQIQLQQLGIRGLQQKTVAKELEMTDEQLQNVKAVFNSQAEKIQEIFKEIKSGNIERSEMGKKFNEVRHSIEADAKKILTEDQQKKFDEMKGEKFQWKSQLRINRPGGKIRKIQIGKPIPAKLQPQKIRFQAQPQKVEKK